MYRIATSGTRKANCIDRDQSAAKPINGGTTAPPTIAVTIRPESGFACSGVRSTTIEKISGKMLAKPSPTRKKPMTARVLLGRSAPRSPRLIGRT